MVLNEIVARKREEVARRMRERPRETLLCPPSDRSFLDALSARRTGFILECKRASPSAGVIREHFDAAEIARAFAPFASAISVLTDEASFGGSFEDLRRVRAAVEQPVLCKDFVVHPYQVYEARSHGADAVLLMLSVLDDETWRECAAAVASLDMHALTEVHDEEEMARAAQLGARIVGINNRNLQTLAVDLTTTPRLAPHRPPGALLVCESGISSHTDVRTYRGMVDAFLVGSAIMREPNVHRAVRQIILGRVKVCGLCREDDAREAWQAGAQWGGLIFAEKSPRRVTLAQARSVREAVRALSWAGVFVNEPPANVASVASVLRLDAVQLHGDEDAAYRAQLRKMLPAECEVWQACRVRPAASEINLAPDVGWSDGPLEGADRILLDTWSPDRRGGTGKTFDWQALDGASDRSYVIVSGGLDPTLAAAADALGAWALDVNSGVEQSVGRKSAARLQLFFSALRGRRGAEVHS